MSDIADMMIEGVLCSQCGVYIEGDEPGHPGLCKACQADADKDDERAMARMLGKRRPHVCPFCRKRFQETKHLEQHMRAKHCWRQESSHATETTDA